MPETVAVLEYDPDLGEDLSGEELALVRAEVWPT
jgi:hypothetical protein